MLHVPWVGLSVFKGRTGLLCKYKHIQYETNSIHASLIFLSVANVPCCAMQVGIWRGCYSRLCIFRLVISYGISMVAGGTLLFATIIVTMGRRKA